jgi:hypothetical protein
LAPGDYTLELTVFKSVLGIAGDEGKFELLRSSRLPFKIVEAAKKS